MALTKATFSMIEQGKQFNNALDYGVVGDGITNDTTALQNAINASANGVLYIPEGIYLCSQLNLVSNLTVIGAGQNNTIIRSNGTNVASFVVGISTDNVTVQDLQVDFADISSVTATSALGFLNSNFVAILNCKIVKFNKLGIGINSTRYFWIQNNYIERTTPDAQGVNECMLATDTGSQTTQYGWVQNNICINAGTIWQASYIWFENNYVLNWRYGAAIALAKQTYVAYNVVLNNYFQTNYTGLDSDNLPVNGIECYASLNKLEGNIISGASGCGIFVGGKNNIIKDNICFDNNTYTGLPSPNGAIVLSYNSSTYNADGAIVSGNICFDNAGASGTQQYGLIIGSNVVGAFNVNMSILNNAFSNNKIGSVLCDSTALVDYLGPVYTASATATLGTIANGASSNVAITLPGANLGDFCIGSCTENLLGLSISAYASGTNAGVVVVTNNTGSPVTLAAATFRISATRPLK
jgi:parallel beta-helix repeat protein